MIENNIKSGSSIIWQHIMDDDIKLNGEPSLIISSYSDILCIKQEGNTININFENIRELIKTLNFHLSHHK